MVESAVGEALAFVYDFDCLKKYMRKNVNWVLLKVSVEVKGEMVVVWVLYYGYYYHYMHVFRWLL